MNRKEAVAFLKEGVQRILDSEQYQRFLSFRSRFRTYSLHNRMLIFLQYPNATLVAGRKLWEELGRFVKPAEVQNKIWIYKPVLRTVQESQEDGTIVERQVVRFITVPVYDVSQTDGAPLPEEPRPTLLQGENPQPVVWHRTIDLLQSRGYRVEDADLGSMNGRTVYDQNLVQIHRERSPLQRLKTLLHEAGHALLHRPPLDPPRSEEERETEAESVAYLVLAHFGIDSGEYSFAYLAGWGTNYKRLMNSLARIEACADEIIAAVEAPEEAHQSGRTAAAAA